MLKNPVWKSEQQAEQMRFIPESLKIKRQWVCWKLDGRKKLPFDAKTGRMASSTDNTTWSSYEVAQDAAEKYGYNGVGYEIVKGEIAIDLDHCRDEAGNLTPLARNIINQFKDCYIEISQSGGGIHIICKGEITSAIKTAQVEIYGEKRYIAITAKAIFPGEPQDKQSEVNQLWSWLDKQRNGKQEKRKERPQVDYACSLSAREVIDKACASRGGDIFSELYAGRWEHLSIGDGSQSASDLSLMNKLAFWCAGDSALMMEIFRSSGLFRDERKAKLALNKALADCREYYTGRR
jgi:putative DNA primase/helicase